MAASSDSSALSKSSCCGSVTSTTLSNSGLHSSSSGRLTTGTGYFNGFTSGHPGRLGKISLHKGLLLEYTQFTVQATWGETRTFRISVPKYPTKDPNPRILANQTSRFTHYYSYIRDEVLGPIIVRVASFFPFHATYCINGHSFIERELERTGIGFRKNDNAFLAVDDVTALQAAADRLSPAVI